MIRNALSASLIALGVAASGALAADESPRLVNTGGDFDVVHGSGHANVVGGTHAVIAGGGDNMSYHAAPGARGQEHGPVARLVGGGDDARLVYERTAPAAATLLADARRR